MAQRKAFKPFHERRQERIDNNLRKRAATKTLKKFPKKKKAKAIKVATLIHKFQKIKLKNARGLAESIGALEAFPVNVIFDLAGTHKVMLRSIVAWNLQPLEGTSPVNLGNGSGPRPIFEYWDRLIRPPLNTFQVFMQDTMRLFYKNKTPKWALQEWDIKLTVVTSLGTFNFEKRNYIQAYLDPNF